MHNINKIKSNLSNKTEFWWIRTPHRFYYGCVGDIYVDGTVDYSNVEQYEGITPTCII